MSFDSFRVGRRRAVAHALAFAIGVTALGAHAENALDFDQALRLAQDRSRQLAAQDAAARAAGEMAVAAGQLPDPMLKLGIDNLPTDGPDRFSLTRDFMTQRSIGIAQEFTRADKRQARAARFDREADAARAGGVLALADLQRDTAIAWLDRHYQERIRDALVAQRDEARLQVDAAEAAYRGGKGAQADLFVARAAVVQIEDRIAQAERQVATARIGLARWVGDAADRPLGARPTVDTVNLAAVDLETRLAHHPQIAVLSAQEGIAGAEAALARSNKKADWSAELMFAQRGPAFSNMVSFNVSIPLQWDQRNRQDRELAAKLAVVEQMHAQREEAAREHVAEALAMLAEWRSNRARLTRYDGALIPLAAERTRAALAAYRGGTSPLAAVLDARRNEIDTRLERLRLEMETARLWARLNYLIPADHDVAASRP
ncbi:putative outer membrane cation efflux protein [Azoarcus sp. CIB]|uniref:TolC family protein n=1 Tax=Aromatoleum sp. (strain CIB) TaxID=198107 RepID=UPI00067D3C2F|nr:TolC family protein [Azoarcus sp. CIB]AKU11574.1 putative outer membrane cation efflux protein [Azoarcus sp. CIB]